MRDILELALGYFICTLSLVMGLTVSGILAYKLVMWVCGGE